MTPFEIVTPASLAEAASLLDPEDTAVRPVGGATALMLMMKAGIFQPTRLVSLRAVEPRFRAIESLADGSLRIGAVATLAAIGAHPAVRAGWPVLAAAMPALANPRVRHVATLGGHLAHADPHMDLPPLLSALGAKARIVGPRSDRALAVEDLCTGYYETALARDELIAEVIVPPLGPRYAAYRKVTTRAADDWPALGIAVVLEGGRESISAASVVLGAATDRPTRLRAAEAALAGRAPDDATLAAAGEAAAAEIDIAGDAHGSAAYKKALLAVHLGRAVRAALDAGPGGTR